MSEATALPNEPQPLPNKSQFLINFTYNQFTMSVNGDAVMSIKTFQLKVKLCSDVIKLGHGTL